MVASVFGGLERGDSTSRAQAHSGPYIRKLGAVKIFGVPGDYIFTWLDTACLKETNNATR